MKFLVLALVSSVALASALPEDTKEDGHEDKGSLLTQPSGAALEHDKEFSKPGVDFWDGFDRHVNSESELDNEQFMHEPECDHGGSISLFQEPPKSDVADGHDKLPEDFGKGAPPEESHGRKVITVTKKVPVPVPHPYPVEVIKHVPIPVPHPVPYVVHKPYPVYVNKPYPVAFDKPVPYTVEKKVPFPIYVPQKVPVPHPFEVLIPKFYPYPVHFPVKVPVPHLVTVYEKVPVFAHFSAHGGEGQGREAGSGGEGDNEKGKGRGDERE